MTDNIVVHKRFKTFISVLYVISYIFLGIFAFMTLCVIGGSIAIPFLPLDQISNWLQTAPIETTYQGTGLSVQITDELIETVSITRSSLFLLAGSTLLVALNFTAITYFVNRWLKNMKSADIFTEQNSKMIEYVAYAFVVLAFIQGLVGLAFQHFIYESLVVTNAVEEIYSFIQGGGYDYSFSIVTLFSGVFIWIIAKVFKYGAFLQYEYDQTV